MVQTDTDLRKSAQACVRLVLPSEWAKLDVCTYTFYSDVYEHPQRDSTKLLTIETSQIVQNGEHSSAIILCCGLCSPGHHA